MWTSRKSIPASASFEGRAGKRQSTAVLVVESDQLWCNLACVMTLILILIFPTSVLNEPVGALFLNGGKREDANKDKRRRQVNADARACLLCPEVRVGIGGLLPVFWRAHVVRDAVGERDSDVARGEGE